MNLTALPETIPQVREQRAILADHPPTGPLWRVAQRFGVVYQFGSWQRLVDDLDNEEEFGRIMLGLEPTLRRQAEAFAPAANRTEMRRIVQRGGNLADPLQSAVTVGYKGWCVGPLERFKRQPAADTVQLDVADRWVGDDDQ